MGKSCVVETLSFIVIIRLCASGCLHVAGIVILSRVCYSRASSLGILIAFS